MDGLLVRFVSHMLHDEAVRVAFVRGGIDVKGPDGVRDGRGYIDGVRRLEDDGGLRYGSAVTVGDATAKAHLCIGSVRDQQGRKEGQEGKNRSHDESFDGGGSFSRQRWACYSSWMLITDLRSLT